MHQDQTNRPNTFIVGAPKCGTTALHSYLSSHPDVFMTTVKEPHFFCHDFPGLRRFPSLSEYLELFAEAGPQHKIVGEATSRYLYSQEAIPNILEFAPAARFIAMLRNPIELVHSLHGQLIYQYTENEADFVRAWRLQNDRRAGRSIPPSCPCVDELFYGEVAQLGRQLQNMFHLVPREQCHVILFDDFKTNPHQVYLDTLRFLDLKDDGRVTFARVNPHKKYRSAALAKLIVDPPYPLSSLKSGLKETFGWKETRIGRWIYARMTVPTGKSPLDPALRAELSDYFADDIRLLEQLLKRDLSHWQQPFHDLQVAG